MAEIIIPILIFSGLSLLAGILLSMASIFFHVPVNDKVEKIRFFLPGINCGSCGFGGCDDYAEEVAERGADCNLCTPGGSHTARKISEIMGIEIKEVVEMVAFVNCNGIHEATSDKYEYEGILSCAAASHMYAGHGKCEYSCLGYGDCEHGCKYDAIHIIDGVALVDPCKCTGCMICVKNCPKSIISMRPVKKSVMVLCSSKNNPKATRQVCENGCIGCKKCEKFCTRDAVHVKNNLAVIDYEKCDDCGKCVEACPVHCIFGVISSEFVSD